MAPEVVRPDRQHSGKADRRIHRVAPADPVPKAEHVGGIDAEFPDLFRIGRYRDQSVSQPIARRSLASRRTNRARRLRWSWSPTW